jgi:hypothetical protein
MLHEEQILRTGQNELTGAMPVSVYLLFDIGQQARCVLDFVVDDGRRIELQKSARVAYGGGSDIRWLQGNDPELRSIEVLEKRGLARLAWSN